VGGWRVKGVRVAVPGLCLHPEIRTDFAARMGSAADAFPIQMHEDGDVVGQLPQDPRFAQIASRYVDVCLRSRFLAIRALRPVGRRQDIQEIADGEVSERGVAEMGPLVDLVVVSAADLRASGVPVDD
jgi:hypothetical protein